MNIRSKDHAVFPHFSGVAVLKMFKIDAEKSIHTPTNPGPWLGWLIHSRVVDDSATIVVLQPPELEGGTCLILEPCHAQTWWWNGPF